MKKTLACAAILLALQSCSVNIRNTDIEFDAGRDMKVDASGATNSTDTKQDAKGDFSGILEAAKEWADKTLAGALEGFKIPEGLKLPEVKPVEPVAPVEPVTPVKEID